MPTATAKHQQAISWNPLRPPAYAVVEARLPISMQDYELGLRRARE